MTATPPDPAPTTRVEIGVSRRTILTILLVVAGVWLLGQLTTVLEIVLVALVLVGTFDPLVAWLERKGFPRGRALVLVFVAAALGLAAVVLLMVPPLIAQALDLVEKAPKYRADLVAQLHGHRWARSLISAVNDLPLDNIAEAAGAKAIGYSTKLLEYIGYGISTLFLAIYLLADPVRAKGQIYAVVPRHHHVKLARILLELKVIVGGYMRGQLITSASITGFVFLLLTISGADNALPIALFAGLTDLIPFVGGYIASTPVVIAATPHGLTVTLVVVCIMILYQEFESRILVPRVYGRVLRLPPAMVLVALLVGASLAGILGALLALPIAAGLQMLVRELHVDLPGEVGADDKARIDERATEVYERVTEGIGAVEAGMIADEMASIVKRSEDTGTAVDPAVLARLAPAGERR
ncbi:MAG: AI-2E family transporter [Kofleriaceae bacterium]|nr:AI-2E family transporter [Kofleriaceae bacterium]